MEMAMLHWRSVGNNIPIVPLAMDKSIIATNRCQTRVPGTTCDISSVYCVGHGVQGGLSMLSREVSRDAAALNAEH